VVPIQISTYADSFSEIYELNRSLSVNEILRQLTVDRDGTLLFRVSYGRICLSALYSALSH
jgi:hypothetical protein